MGGYFVSFLSKLYCYLLRKNSYKKHFITSKCHYNRLYMKWNY